MVPIGVSRRVSLRPGRPSAQAGFTLLELMVVLTILGLLAFVAAPPFLRYLSQGRTEAARLQIQGLGSALDLYAFDVGRYPSAQEGLAALVSRPNGTGNWNGPYVKRPEMLTDPWGHPYRYRIPGEHGQYDIWSLGPRGTDGGEADSGDLRSW